MWLLELMLLSLVGGTILGVGWRIVDDWRERSQAEAARKATQEATTAEKQ
jgi:hypothetical protein